MNVIKCFSAVLALTLCVTSNTTNAQNKVYRWVDDEGVVHFGDRPAGTGEIEEIDLPAPRQAMPDNAEIQDSEQVTEKSYAQQQREERAKKGQEARERKQAVAAGCAQRREIVAQLEPSTRVMVTGEDGEIYRLDDRKRLESLDEATTYISRNCQ